MSEQKTAFDAHCHLFNLGYLVSELLAMGWDALWGNYPRQERQEELTERQKEREKKDLLESIGDLLEQLSELGLSLVQSFEQNYELLKKHFLEENTDQTDLNAIPLMMDIYYMFSDPPEREDFVDGQFSEELGDDPEANFKLWSEHLRKRILRGHGISLDHQELERDRKKYLLKEMEEQLNAVFMDHMSYQKGERRGIDGVDTVMTPGYKKELNDSLKLQQSLPEQIYPFLAVDPRRENIMELVKARDILGVSGPLVSSQGPFYGIKVYPRLGYTPDDLEKIGLLQWCADEGIPLTLHCNTSGFPPFKNWSWSDYSDPGLWEDYLIQYKDAGLRINFAHWGYKNSIWSQKILDYIENKEGKYTPNVYTDISCFVVDGSMKEAQAVYAQHPDLKYHVQFGTDYDVMLLVGNKNLKEYFQEFNQVFGVSGERDYIEELRVTAPRNFLGL